MLAAGLALAESWTGPCTGHEVTVNKSLSIRVLTQLSGLSVRLSTIHAVTLCVSQSPSVIVLAIKYLVCTVSVPPLQAITLSDWVLQDCCTLYSCKVLLP